MRFACLAALLVVAAVVDGSLEKQWQDFRAKYKKTYNGRSEEEDRRAVFEKNIGRITAVNEEKRGYQLGVNQFADLTQEEFTTSYMVNGLTEDVWVKAHQDAALLGRHNWDGSALPDSVDWDAMGAVTPVKNQGQCGSCWSFSTTGALESEHQIASGNLVSLSEQQFVDCAGSFGNNGCSGGLMANAFRYAETVGVCTEASYPYTAVDGGACGATSSDCAIGLPKGAVSGFVAVRPKSVEDLKSALAQGPVSVAVQADQWQLYKVGVFDNSACGSRLDHGVLAVGYGSDSGSDYWRIKNSWGTTWGERGFIRLTQKQGFWPWQKAGMCGILLNAVQPTVVNSAAGFAI